MNTPITKKDIFEKAHAKIAHDMLVQIIETHNNVYEQWYSSALNLSTALNKHNVLLPYKLYYNYKFPNNMTNIEMYNDKLLLIAFYIAYKNFFSRFTETNMIVNMAEYASHQTDMTTFFKFCTHLGLSDIKHLQTLCDTTYEKCYETILKLADDIWRLNPELQHIKNYKNMDFVNGAIYGFAPNEIDFFIKNRGIDVWLTTQQDVTKIEDYIQEPVTYCLAPTTIQDLLVAIDKSRQLFEKSIKSRI